MEGIFVASWKDIVNFCAQRLIKGEGTYRSESFLTMLRREKMMP